jgi:small subunit ribosomal protein S4
MEQQMRRYMEAAQKQPGITGQYLLQLLERRLDNVMYRLNFADSRKQGRQLVLHGHIAVNGHKVDIPSFIVKPDDVVTWTEGSKEDEFVQSLVADGAKRPLPSWLNLDSKNLTGHVLSMPQPEDLDTKLNTRLIVEFYSR